MFVSKERHRIARKWHRCTYCGEAILPVQRYVYWANVDNGWVDNKMHPECLADLQQSSDFGEFEYTPFSGERPKLEE